MIKFEGIGKSFGSKSLFSEVSCHLPPGEKIALMGENGSGKSTLLKIIGGQEDPDSGTLSVPSQFKVASLPQQPNPSPESTILKECQGGHKELVGLQKKLRMLEDKMSSNPEEKDFEDFDYLNQQFENAGGRSFFGKAERTLLGLGFKEKDFERSPLELSLGWRMRLELAKLFMTPCQLIILDEPTNHLDLPTIVWVERFLQDYEGTLLFVTHDEALLTRLATHILHLHKGRLLSYKGGHQAFLNYLEKYNEEKEAQRKKIMAKTKQLSDFVNRFGAKASKASQAQSKQKTLDRLEADLVTLETLETASKGMHFHLPTPPRSEKVLCRVKALDIGYQQPLVKNISFQIEKNTKTAVIGANGVGKSTLLKTLAQQLSPLGGSVDLAPSCVLSMFNQDLTEKIDTQATVLENLLRISEVGEKEARSILGGFLFRGEDVFKSVKVLSGGELSRLGLACTFAQNPNFLLLDEPTNHLDSLSIKQLIKGIQSYEGTLVVVSHNRDFINQTCHQVLGITETGESQLFLGNLEDFSHLAQVAGFPDLTKPSLDLDQKEKGSVSDKKTSAHGDYKTLKSKKQKLEKSLSQSEKKLENLKTQIKKEEQKVQDFLGQNKYQEMASSQQQIHKWQEEMSSEEEKWILGSEELEETISSLKEMGRL